MCFFLDLLVLTCNISIETCAYVLLSWYALRGEALRPPPCTPPPAFIFKPVSPCYLLFLFFLHKHHRLFGLISSLLISIETCAYVLLSWSCRSYLQYIHWDLCLCASLLVRIAGGGAAPSPLAPPHPLLFLNRFPLLPTIPFFLHKHHRLFGLISSLLISIETCAYVLLSWSSRSYLQYIHWDLCLCASLLVRIAGGGAAPSPLHPPTRFYF